MESQRKFAVQKPQGKKWETLALVDNLSAGKREFSEAVRSHGRGYVRLIQVDFESEEALSNYDWRLVELHDPYKGKGRPKPTVVAGSERATKPKKGKGPSEKVAVPIRTWMLACLVAVAVGVMWVVTYHRP